MSAETQLMNHTPWTLEEFERERDAVKADAARETARQTRVAHWTLTGGAAIAFLGALYLFKGTLPENGSFVVIVVGMLLSIYGLNCQAKLPSVQALLGRWRFTKGPDALTTAELATLEELSAQSPVANSRLKAWISWGLVIRERDRDAIEAYLRSQGLKVDEREVSELDYVLDILEEGAAA